jgi:hypothetical protein
MSAEVGRLPGHSAVIPGVAESGLDKSGSVLYAETMMPDGLHERLRAAAGQRTKRTLSQLTNTPSETVRRYMTTQAPAAEFLSLFCSSLGINGDWLLTGRGPMKASDVKHHALGEARAGDLLGAMAGSIEVLIDRVDRTEKYVQTLETRVRGTSGDSAVEFALKAPKNGGTHAHPQRQAGIKESSAASATRAHQASERARRIADAIAGRPCSDAD